LENQSLEAMALEFLRNDIQHEKTQDIDIDETWLLSLKKVLIAFFGCESIDPLMFEHGRNIGQTFFHKLESERNQQNSSQRYLNEFCEWLRKKGFGT
jgi:hypothetical protein